MNPPILQVKNIEVVRHNKKILDVEDFSLKQGDVTGLIGPNGAGKSTLVKTLALLEPPTGGEIYFRGIRIWPGSISMNVRRQMAVVFQQPLMFHTTVFQNVAVSLRLRRVPRRQVKERVDYWLDQFGIRHLADRNARTLSGGEAQRVNLARAMVVNPRVLFLDEPFTALDLPTKRSLLRDFRRILAETDTTAVLISHDYQEVKYLCREMHVIFDGKIQFNSHVDHVEAGELPTPLSRFVQDFVTPLSDERPDS
ncbi:MAG: ATP-binding cassette domain-containing protein [Bacillaceae bacterium]|nr:ATP-binding cassette domain-containing protein [Bacillaceae bacterium]